MGIHLRFKGLHAPAQCRKLGRQGVIVRLQRLDRLNQRRGHLRVGEGLLAVAAGGHEFGKDRRDLQRGNVAVLELLRTEKISGGHAAGAGDAVRFDGIHAAGAGDAVRFDGIHAAGAGKTIWHFHIIHADNIMQNKKPPYKGGLQ